jgi:hypothetical protein
MKEVVSSTKAGKRPDRAGTYTLDLEELVQATGHVPGPIHLARPCDRVDVGLILDPRPGIWNCMKRHRGEGLWIAGPLRPSSSACQ